MFDGKIPTQPPGMPHLQPAEQQENEERTSAAIKALKALIASGIVIVLGFLYYRQQQVTCPFPLLSEKQCKEECQSECIDAEYGGVMCKKCEGGRVSAQAITCPNNTTSDSELCDAECDNGICYIESTVQDTACYSCLTCKKGDYAHKDTCEISCPFGCTLMGEQNGLSCWGCKQDCTTVCTERGYDPPGTKYYEYLRSEITQYSCVSGFGVQDQGFLIDDCECAIKPKITVDTTKPVCPKSPCGPIICNEVETCTLENGQEAQVTCRWQGWDELSPGVFVPKIGG